MPRRYNILAAEYAEIGMMDRAIAGIKEALKVDATLWTAHLQLGLAHLTLNQMDDARIAWEPLKKLEETDPLRLFSEGLTHLLDEDIAATREKLLEGIRLNNSNPALSNDMQGILDNFTAMTTPTETVTDSASDHSKHLVADAYKTST